MPGAKAPFGWQRTVTGIVGALMLCALAVPAIGETVHVDANRGNDASDGRTPATAWRTLRRLARAQILPGATVFLHRGSRWREPLRLVWSGRAGAPIVVRAYGRGSRPLVAPEGIAGDAVSIVNVEHIHLHDIEVTNQGAGPAIRRGVLIAADDIGTLRDVRVSGLYIHDVRGTNARKDNGGIVFRTAGAHVPSRFVGLRIERNIIRRVDRSGIVGSSNQLSPANWFPSLGVAIRDNYLEDMGGDAITPWATDGALIEHNIVRGAAQRAPGYNAGVWQWSTDNTVIRLNDVGGTRGTRDGQGFDSDYNSSNTRFFYNYSHGNEGGFLLVCSPARNERSNIGNSGTLARWNISRHDRARVFHLSGADDITIEQNAVYIAPGDDVQLLLVSAWDGWPRGAHLRDNLFMAEGIARYGHGVSRDEATGLYRLAPGWGGAREIDMRGNRRIGRHIDAPPDEAGTGAPQPLVTNWTPPKFPGADPARFASFLDRHRNWMVRLMSAQFGVRPILDPVPLPRAQRLPGRTLRDRLRSSPSAASSPYGAAPPRRHAIGLNENSGERS